MSITAKELAARLGLSEAAVSMALNDKPGISRQRKKEILAAAEKYGYDFTRVNAKHSLSGSVYFIIYRKHGAVVADTPFFTELSEGVEEACRDEKLKIRTQYLYENEDLLQEIESLRYSDCIGLILLGTEMQKNDFRPFSELPFPVILLDASFQNQKRDAVLIDNVQGAYLATNYLISRIHAQPGYLRSSYSISNFEDRADGFYKAIRENGLSTGKSPVHRLTPSIEGAEADMKTLLREGLEPARGYFADNDLIAVGAMRAFQAAGYRIPEDIAVIGFDNMPIANYISPGLTTVNVPKKYMGEQAVKRLKELFLSKNFVPVRLLVGVNLVRRDSV